MDQARRLEANRILERLLASSAAERDALARTLCGDDAELAALVARLRAHAEQADDTTLPNNAGWRDALEALADPPPELHALGAYRLLRRLGIGGSAEVYLAEREVDGVVQRVALKYLHADARSTTGLARFRQEQQILARLTHPDIARVIDIGQAQSGRPYFVMEYIDGEPIDTWCDRRDLDIRQRLRLFARVVDAVAYAHRHLVVHRDIKPSNVLVDRDGNPKLVDFGIAKLLDERSGETALTEPGRSPATPGYASPEQLLGHGVGLASDVYQLGILLHVLLIGVRPQVARGIAADEAAALAASEPPPPSVRLRRLLDSGDRRGVRDIAEHRRAGVRRLLRTLAGDLDRIVLRAIALHPEDRYPSAAHFAEDVRAFLAGRPVSARRQSWWYLLGKTFRRYPLPMALAVALIVSLAAFAAVVTNIALDLDRARRTAQLQGQLAGSVLDHVIETLRSLEPELSGFDQSLARLALDRAAEAPPARFGDDPLTQAHLRLTLGKGYETLWAIDDAEAQYRAAVALLPQLDRSERTAIEPLALNALGRIGRASGRLDDAIAAFERVLALTDGDAAARTLNASARANLATVLGMRGEPERVLALYRRAAVDFDAIYGPSHPNSIALGMNIVLTLLQDESRAPADWRREALERLATLVPLAEQSLGRQASLSIQLRLLRGRALVYLARFDDGVAQLRETLPDAMQVLGEQGLSTLMARAVLGHAMVRRGDHDAGIAESEAALAQFVERWGSEHPNTRGVATDLALAYAFAGRRDDAIRVATGYSVDRDLLAEDRHWQPLLDDPRMAAPR